MEFKSFCEQVVEVMKEKYPDTKFNIVDLLKNNGIVYTALCMTDKGSKLSENIYLNDLYNAFCEGVSFIEIVNRIDAARQKSKGINFNVEFFRDFDKVRDRLHIKLVNYDSNKGMLNQCPHRKFKDLAIMYYVSVKGRPSEGIIVIKNEHTSLWNVTEDDLYDAAMRNAIRENDYDLLPIMKVLGLDFYESDDSDLDKLQILTNKDKTYGASVIMTPGLLQAISREFDRNFYIIPSSIHEVILFLDDEMEFNFDTALSLKMLVGCVNKTELEPQDILSENVYYYDGDIDKLIDVNMTDVYSETHA